VQVLPPQHGVRLPGALAVPHFAHRPLPKDELQTVSAPVHLVVPGQQGSPGPPHFWQVASPPVELKQARVASLQRWFEQQGAPITPHFTQLPLLLKVPPVQAVSGSVQRTSTPFVLCGQQGSPTIPQVHRPEAHIPNATLLTVQVSPAAWQRPCKQQFEPLQLFPPQQGSPGSPHFWQRLAPAAQM
jgi:hypothetical protein